MANSKDIQNQMRYLANFNKLMCQQKSPTLNLCEGTLTALCGQNKDEVQIDIRILPDYLKHIAHSVSIKQINHYFQLYSSGTFRQYDYRDKNRKIYNSSTPPDYNLNNVKVPTYIYSGGSDMIVSEIDVENLRELLPNVKTHRSIRNFNHCDFNYGKNTRSILFNDIVKAMNAGKK
jgi:lysosomal acid lipase/cholesteryl ester hydrolase